MEREASETGPGAPPVGRWREAVDRRLAGLLADDSDVPQPLAAAMRVAVLAPGKRLRPVLAMATTFELGRDPAQALDAGCALEMIHAASLALDDLPCMDDATLRRGQPALHRRVGEDVAILTAIALLSRAFELLAHVPGLPEPTRLTLVGALAQCAGAAGLAGGQHEDLRGAALRTHPIAARRCNQRKTGAAFIAAVEIGAAIGGAPPARCMRLRRFARHLGCAFQLRDDLLDATATRAEIGKDIGQDLDRRTTVALLGIEGTTRLLRAHLQAARRALDVAPAAAEPPARSPLLAMLDEVFGRDAAPIRPRVHGGLAHQA